MNVNRGWGARQAAEGTYGQFCGNNLDSDTAYIGIRWNGIGVVTNGGSAPRHNQVDANFAAGVPAQSVSVAHQKIAARGLSCGDKAYLWVWKFK